MLLGLRDGCGQLRALVERVGSLPGLHLAEGLDQPEALGLGEPPQRFLLGFQAEARLPLLLGTHSRVGDCGLHPIVLNLFLF